MTQTTPSYEIDAEWVHLQYEEKSQFTETYGFSGNQGAVNLEGLVLRPRGKPSRTLLIFMHPSSTLQLLPVPREAVHRGAHVLCAASRYAKNDAALIMEKVFLDLGAYIRHAKEKWGYEKIVLVGWSGGGSLAVCYQAEAQDPRITETPAGDPVNVRDAGLIPADAVIFQAAHLSRAHLLQDMLDPSVTDETKPDERDKTLDIYDKSNPNQPPYTPEYIARYRRAQQARMQRITAWVRKTLQDLKQRNTDELERGFVVHRTLADPRFLDKNLDPNGRKPNWCYLGKPETVNTGPVGLARFCTLRSWLSQWSLEDTRANGLDSVRRLRGPLLVIENSADDAVPQPHTGMLFNAATTQDKTMVVIEGATHYYAGQPALLNKALDAITDWLAKRHIAV
ncbi:MAG: alpha/beta fold hydrolase [Burkholderiaceae bacterium]|nr:alpha/beta fold hydrolase [Burkholderiaceae bacterium]